jgi:glycosyltransferase involved in cell wall biosynthesis
VTTIAFVIPTWKRPKQLEVCVDSIASQITEGDGVRIHIVQDGERPETVEAVAKVQEKYPFVIVTKNEHSDYSAAFRAMFRAEPEADWVWTFGDDDMLRPGGLKFALEQLPNWQDLSFIHIAELKRASGASIFARASCLLDLCNELGWIEMTGFISGNLTRGHLLAKAAETPNWRAYSKSAFVQSAALLETLCNEPCAFMDIPVFTSQDSEQTGESIATWNEQNISVRYLHIVDAIELMLEQGILKKKVRPKFFRYLTGTMWDRFLSFFTTDFLKDKWLWDDEAWGRVVRFAQFIDDETAAKQLIEDVEAVKGMALLCSFMDRNAEGIRTELKAILARRDAGIYPYSFAPPVEVTEAATSTESQ